MIETFYGTDRLVVAPGPQTFFIALLIGIAFGFVLERAGFGSSRRLAGIFYFRDMSVLKVMFSALITGMLGLMLCSGMGWLDLGTQVNLLTTHYGAQAVGGLVFGVGFVLSGWCPGTAAVGVASGKLDAIVFLIGVVLGSAIYNETYSWTATIREWGVVEEPVFAFGMSRNVFALGMTLAAVGAFYLSELVERFVAGTGKYLTSPILKATSLGMVVMALAMFIFPDSTNSVAAWSSEGSAETAEMLASIENAEDHFEPEELADRLVRGDAELLVVDVRSAEEFQRFHLRGAVNVPLSGLVDYLEPYRDVGQVVLYSNGMTHPAQARDLLAQTGFRNVYMLTGGLAGFVDWCLKPVSLRDEPLAAEDAQRVRTWRAYFLASDAE